VLSALGLGFLFNERVLAPLIIVFLTLGVGSIAWSTRSHGRIAPLSTTVLGAGGVVGGRLIWSVPPLLYTGVSLFVRVASRVMWKMKMAHSSGWETTNPSPAKATTGGTRRGQAYQEAEARA
jgi:hypothetical protein